MNSARLRTARKLRILYICGKRLAWYVTAQASSAPKASASKQVKVKMGENYIIWHNPLA